MNNKLSDEEITELLSQRSVVEQEIRILSKKLRGLERQNKNLNQQIFDGCKHNWVKDRKYFTYDDRFNICTKCNFIR